MAASHLAYRPRCTRIELGKLTIQSSAGPMAPRWATTSPHMSTSIATGPSATLPRFIMQSRHCHAPPTASSGSSPLCSNSTKSSSIWRGNSSAGVFFLHEWHSYKHKPKRQSGGSGLRQLWSDEAACADSLAEPTLSHLHRKPLRWSKPRGIKWLGPALDYRR